MATDNTVKLDDMFDDQPSSSVRNLGDMFNMGDSPVTVSSLNDMYPSGSPEAKLKSLEENAPNTKELDESGSVLGSTFDVVTAPVRMVFNASAGVLEKVGESVAERSPFAGSGNPDFTPTNLKFQVDHKGAEDEFYNNRQRGFIPDPYRDFRFKWERDAGRWTDSHKGFAADLDSDQSKVWHGGIDYIGKRIGKQMGVVDDGEGLYSSKVLEKYSFRDIGREAKKRFMKPEYLETVYQGDEEFEEAFIGWVNNRHANGTYRSPEEEPRDVADMLAEFSIHENRRFDAARSASDIQDKMNALGSRVNEAETQDEKDSLKRRIKSKAETLRHLNNIAAGATEIGPHNTTLETAAAQSEVDREILNSKSGFSYLDSLSYSVGRGAAEGAYGIASLVSRLSLNGAAGVSRMFGMDTLEKAFSGISKKAMFDPHSQYLMASISDAQASRRMDAGPISDSETYEVASSLIGSLSQVTYVTENLAETLAAITIDPVFNAMSKSVTKAMANKTIAYGELAASHGLERGMARVMLAAPKVANKVGLPLKAGNMTRRAAAKLFTLGGKTQSSVAAARNITSGLMAGAKNTVSGTIVMQTAATMDLLGSLSPEQWSDNPHMAEDFLDPFIDSMKHSAGMGAAFGMMHSFKPHTALWNHRVYREAYTNMYKRRKVQKAIGTTAAEFEVGRAAERLGISEKEIENADFDALLRLYTDEMALVREAQRGSVPESPSALDPRVEIAGLNKAKDVLFSHMSSIGPFDFAKPVGTPQLAPKANKPVRQGEPISLLLEESGGRVEGNIVKEVEARHAKWQETLEQEAARSSSLVTEIASKEGESPSSTIKIEGIETVDQLADVLEQGLESLGSEKALEAGFSDILRGGLAGATRKIVQAQQGVPRSKFGSIEEMVDSNNKQIRDEFRAGGAEAARHMADMIPEIDTVQVRSTKGTLSPDKVKFRPAKELQKEIIDYVSSKRDQRFAEIHDGLMEEVRKLNTEEMPLMGREGLESVNRLIGYEPSKDMGIPELMNNIMRYQSGEAGPKLQRRRTSTRGPDGEQRKSAAKVMEDMIGGLDSIMNARGLQMARPRPKGNGSFEDNPFSRHEWSEMPAETIAGSRIIEPLKASANASTKEKVNTSHVFDLLASEFSVMMQYMSSNTSRDLPGFFDESAGLAVVRNRGEVNGAFHEIGHQLSLLLKENDPSILASRADMLLDLQNRRGSRASSAPDLAGNLSEGFSELFRRYIMEPDTLAGHEVAWFENAINRNQLPNGSPNNGSLGVIRDAHRAMAEINRQVGAGENWDNLFSSPTYNNAKLMSASKAWWRRRLYDVIGSSYVADNFTFDIHKSIIEHSVHNPRGLNAWNRAMLEARKYMGPLEKLVWPLMDKNVKRQLEEGLEKAREINKVIRDTKMDVRSSVHSLHHAIGNQSREVNAAIHGSTTTMNGEHLRFGGVRVDATGSLSEMLPAGERLVLEKFMPKAVETMGKADIRHGDRVQVSKVVFDDIIDKVIHDKSIHSQGTLKGRKLKKAQDKRVEDFYGWYQRKAELDRAEQGQRQASSEFGTVEQMKRSVRKIERQNPDFIDRGKEMSEFFDALLVVEYFGGSKSIDDIARIKSDHQTFYAPLNRQGRSSTVVREAEGSSAPTKRLDLIARERANHVYSNYYLNRAKRSMIEMSERVANDPTLPLLARQGAGRMMVKMEIDQTLVAQLTPEELQGVTGRTLTELRGASPENYTPVQLRIIAAAAANRQLAQSKGIPVSKLEAGEKFNWKQRIGETGKLTDPETQTRSTDYVGVEILSQGKGDITPYPVFRAVEPDAPFIVRSRNTKTGDIEFHMATDPSVWRMLQNTPEAEGTLNNVARALSGMSAPLKQSITSSIAFALRNIPRDMVTSEMLKENSGKFILGKTNAVALVNTMMGKHGGDKLGIELSLLVEEISEAYDPQMRLAPDQRSGESSFLQKRKADVIQMLGQNLMLKGWRTMPTSEKLINLPRQAAGAFTLGQDLVNYVTMGRKLSSMTEMAPRLEAYKQARLKGDSAERAIMAFDSATGLFIQRGGNEVLANYISAMGFVNPALQIMYAQNRRMFKHWDPDVKWDQFFVRQGLIGLQAGIAAASNLALIKMYYGDEADEIYDEMLERSAFERANNVSILGNIRLPLDDGPGGSSAGLAWNLTESLILKADDRDEVLADVLTGFARGTVSPIANPANMAPMHIKTAYETWLNVNSYNGKPIVPENLRRSFPYNPEMQTFPDLPDIYNRVGEIAGVSPLKVKHFVRSVMGGVIDDTMKWQDNVRKEGLTMRNVQEAPAVSGILNWEPIGWRSKSVTRISEIDKGIDAITGRIKGHTENLRTGGLSHSDAEWYRDQIGQLKIRLRQLTVGRRAMSKMEKLSKQATQLKRRGNREGSEAVERRMTKIARDFLESHPDLVELANTVRKGHIMKTE